MRRRWLVLIAIVVALAGVTGVGLYVATATSGGTLKLTGLLDSDEGPPLAVTQCSTGRPPELKSCPEFKSANPIFGQVHFRSGAEGNDPWESMRFYIAFDEIRGTGTGYGIVYFDANGNLDLTDDGPETRIGSKWRPGSTERMDGTSTQADIPPEAEGGLPSYWVTPDLPAWGRRGLWVTFRPDYCRKGSIRIGGRKYEVRLSTASVTGRYDTSLTKFVLYRPQTRPIVSWPGVYGPQAEEKIYGPPSKMWYIRDRWWKLKTNAAGDRVSVEEYKGATGVLQAGKANSKCLMMGGLRSREVEVEVVQPRYESEARRYLTNQAILPVGDYAIVYMNFQVNGVYSFGLQPDFLPKDERPADSARIDEYFIQIRDGRIFELEPPKSVEVRITSPKTSQQFRPGDTIEVRGGLVDTARGFVMEDLTKAPPVPGQAGLDPVIRLSDSTGKVLAERTAGFADILWNGVSIDIPSDVQVTGSEERFILTVTYDTGDLFGVVEGKREIVIRKPDPSPAAPTEP